MKVFISWSGKRSLYIAEALWWWLPNVIQAVVPFISTHDISKGSRGNVTISKNLEDANVGVICLTPENLVAPWILFESGALSKLSTAYVCTFLYELEPADIEPPLGQFQHTKYSQAEMKALLNTINAELGSERRLDVKRLDDAFDTWYPKLEERMKEVPKRPADEKPAEKRADESKIDEILNLVRASRIDDPTRRHIPASSSVLAESDSLDDLVLRLWKRKRHAALASVVPVEILHLLVPSGLASRDSVNGVDIVKLTQLGRVRARQIMVKGQVEQSYPSPYPSPT